MNSNAWYVGLHIINFGLNSISHLCSLVVVVCGRHRPRMQQLWKRNSADSEFEDPHTTDTPIHHVSNKLNETWNILQKEDEHRALSNADTKYNALTHTCALKTTQHEFKWQHCKQTSISGCLSLCGQVNNLDAGIGGKKYCWRPSPIEPLRISAYAIYF